MSIHKATQAKAERNGLVIEEHGDEYIVSTIKGDEEVAKASTAKAALAAALGEEIKQSKSQKSVATPQDDEGDERRMIFKPEYTEVYVANHRSCGDKLSTLLRDATSQVVKAKGKGQDRIVANMGALRMVMGENDIEPNRFDHLNPGQVRMTVGNILRGRARNGLEVLIEGKGYKAKALGLEVNPPKAKKAKPVQVEKPAKAKRGKRKLATKKAA